jgi:hypothetical protein
MRNWSACEQFPKYHLKMFLGDFIPKLDTEDIFRPITGNVTLGEINNDNGVRVVNFATS